MNTNEQIWLMLYAQTFAALLATLTEESTAHDPMADLRSAAQAAFHVTNIVAGEGPPFTAGLLGKLYAEKSQMKLPGVE